jgi:ABC-type transport system involved in multi-copper enzyme maturation permease subunit
MIVSPYLLKGDGTAQGARELYVRFSLGGVFVLAAVTLIAAATGSIAGERSARRLQLTLVRPVGRFSVALGKVISYSLSGAAVMLLSALVMLANADPSVRCDRVVAPVLPSPAEEARAMYETFMNDPSTPPEVKRAKKSVVMRLLTQRAVDHYQTVPTNDPVRWSFKLPSSGELSVRMRFTNQFDMRQDLLGRFVYGGKTVAVSNITQAILKVPLGAQARLSGGAAEELEFCNLGKTALMLRPRKDLHLLISADAFVFNLMRAWLELSAILTLLVAFGVFLSSGLGRPVALFVALAVLLSGEVSPSVISQYPDELETKTVDRIGLYLTRFSAEITRPFSSLSPLQSLSRDECVELGEVVRVLLVNCIAVPALFCLLAAYLMPRKQDY